MRSVINENKCEVCNIGKPNVAYKMELICRSCFLKFKQLEDQIKSRLDKIEEGEE